MLFNSALFWIFFAVFFVAFHFLARGLRGKQWLTLAGSLVFYSVWDFRFVPLLFFMSLADFMIGKKVDDSGTGPARRRWLILCLCINLGLLAFFKYTNFFLDSAFGLLRLAGITKVDSPALNIILPVGISFYTFQGISYVVDVYFGNLKASRTPVTFLAAMSFFPHLLAGPIVRSSTLLPQFINYKMSSWPEIRTGIAYIGVGLFKKSVADLLSVPGDSIFASETFHAHSMVSSWLGALAFTGQAYGDFSGYTDIAIGVALLLGFKLPINFNNPFLAKSPADYWNNRWHLSLSYWIRDYLYLPLTIYLSRSRKGGPMLAMLISMTLVGLWHGAAWNCVFYGVYHGILLVCTYWLITQTPAIAKSKNTAVKIGKVFVTFYLVVIGYVVYRSTGFERFWENFRELHWPTVPTVWDHDLVVSCILIISGLLAVHFSSYVITKADKLKYVLWPVLAVLITFSAVIAGPDLAFIYFQF